MVLFHRKTHGTVQRRGRPGGRVTLELADASRQQARDAALSSHEASLCSIVPAQARAVTSPPCRETHCLPKGCVVVSQKGMGALFSLFFLAHTGKQPGITAEN